MQEEKVCNCDTQNSAIEEKTDDSLECAKNPVEQKGHDSTISTEQFDNLKAQLNDCLKKIGDNLTELDDKQGNLVTLLTRLHSHVQESNQRIRNLEEGYDFHILKNFSKQIIREINKLELLISKNENDSQKAVMQNILDALLELLDRNSITQIVPKVGAVYSENTRFAECLPEKIPTTEAELDGTIAHVVYSGFQYEFNNDQTRIIEPAKVIVYSYNNIKGTSTDELKKRKKIKEIENITLAKLDTDKTQHAYKAKTAQKINGVIFILLIFFLLVSSILNVIIFLQNREIKDLTKQIKKSNSGEHIIKYFESTKKKTKKLDSSDIKKILTRLYNLDKKIADLSKESKSIKDKINEVHNEIQYLSDNHNQD